jgi:hypothetical protein
MRLPVWVQVSLTPVIAREWVWSGNVATQRTSALIVTTPSMQSASPDQPAKLLPGSGTPVNATCVFWSNAALQVPGQTIPVGVLSTVPDPVPESTEVSARRVDPPASTAPTSRIGPPPDGTLMNAGPWSSTPAPRGV